MGNRAYPEDPFHFAPLWDAVLDIHDAFAAVCKKYNLRYYVIGGTLLGAVRHKGFIPWDDDFDLAMPRQDYNKLREVADRELPEHLKLVDHDNTPSFVRSFSKIQETRREFVLDIEKRVNHQLSNGIFIDIFPIDGYPPKGWSELVTRLSGWIHGTVMYTMTFRQNRIPMTFRRFWIYVVGLLLAPVFGFWWRGGALTWNEKYLTKLPFDDAKPSGLGGVMLGKFQMVFKPHLWGKAAELDYCGFKVPAPAEWDEFLKINYGDYMKLPPEDKRCPSHQYSWRCPWWLGPTNQSAHN